MPLTMPAVVSPSTMTRSVAMTEARFRQHFRKVSATEAESLVPLDDMLARLTQSDVVRRRFLDESHRSFVPDFGVFIKAVDSRDKLQLLAISRQMVLFCVERRKAWRMLQSKAGVENQDYAAQRALLARVDAGEIELAAFLASTADLLDAELAAVS